MRKLLTAGLAAVTVIGAGLTATAAAAQGYYGRHGYNNRYDGNRYYRDRGYYRNHGYYNRRRGRDNDEAVAAIAGGLLGYALGAATSTPRTYYAPPSTYYAPPTYYAPRNYYYQPRYCTDYYGRRYSC